MVKGFSICGLMAVSALVTSGVTLVEDGRAVAEVVLPDEPNAVEKTTASEFVKFIRKSSGVRNMS